MTIKDSASTTKRLWMVAQYALPPAMTGGTRHYETALILEDYGWRSKVIASPFNHKTHRFDRPVSLRRPHLTTAEDGVDFTWVYSTPYQGNDARRYVNMLSFLAISQIRAPRDERPSVVLGSSPHLLAAFSGWITARRYRVPFIFEVRDLWPESLIQLGLTNKAIIKPLEWLERFLYVKADHIIALTNGISDGVTNKGIESGKVSLIPNGSESPEPVPSSEIDAIRSELGWRENFVCGWIGAHGNANHLETIVDAARILQDVGNTYIKFVLIGHGPEKEQLIKRATGLENVQFMDPLPKREIMRRLQAMDAGVIVHRDTLAVRGARPNKLFDYMAVGLPIVSDLQGETQGLIRSAQSGITVQPESPRDLAAAVIELSQDKDRAVRMGQNGMRFLATTHDRRLLVSELAKILDRVVGDGEQAGSEQVKT